MLINGIFMKKFSILLLATSVMSTNIWGVNNTLQFQDVSLDGQVMKLDSTDKLIFRKQEMDFSGFNYGYDKIQNEGDKLFAFYSDGKKIQIMPKGSKAPKAPEIPKPREQDNPSKAPSGQIQNQLSNDQQAILDFVSKTQKHLTPILPSITTADVQTFFGKSEESQELAGNRLLGDISKSLPNITQAGVEFTKWYRDEGKKLHPLWYSSSNSGDWSQYDKAKAEFDQTSAERLCSDFKKLNDEAPEEWVKIDGVLVNILGETREFKGGIKLLLDQYAAKTSSISAEEKAVMLKNIALFSNCASVVRLPKTKAMLVSEFDFLFDYVGQVAGEEAKKMLLASCEIQTKLAAMKSFGEMDSYQSSTEAELKKLEAEASPTVEQKAKISELKNSLEEIKASKEEEIKKEVSRGAESTKTLAEVSSSVITQTTSVVATQAATIVADRMMETVTGFASGSEDSSFKFGPWAQGFGSIAKQTANLRNTNAYDLSNIGFLIGCDAEISEKASIGGAFIYSRANVQFYKGDVLNEQANVFNNFGAMLYGQFMPTDNVSVDAQGSFILNKMTLEKGSEKTAKVGFAGVNAKYYLPVGSFMIIPKIGFNGLMGSFDADAAGSKDKDSKLNGEVSKMVGALGLGFQRAFVTESEMKITPELHIGADYMFTGNARNMDNIIAIKGYENELKLLEMADRSTLNIGVSLNVKKTDSFDVAAGVDASATATHLVAKMGLKSFKDTKIDGDFYSVGGYLKIKLSL